MTDRELLEAAAKAAGIELIAWTKFFDEWKFACNPCGEPWNPLTDDGDALRLAVKLGIKVMPYPVYDSTKHSVCASRRSLAPPEDDENTYVGPDCIEVYGSDPYAATRRAIVRAAAEIGKSINP